MDVRVILVEPKLEENIGAVARVMKNFGFSELYLVRPHGVGRRALAVASHAADVVENCVIAPSLEEALRGSDVAVGTTAKLAASERRHLRAFLTPRELRRVCRGGGKVSVVFGREDIGLLNEELKMCDVVVHIPTDPRYPVMNVSHAAAVILYELYLGVERRGVKGRFGRPASFEERAQFYEHLMQFLDRIQYAEHKRERVLLVVKRIFGRAAVTSRELRALRGVLRKAIWCLSGEHAARRADDIKPP
ncbi:MAG: RNA methyltransferase [Candidatus Alkanophagales archaeon]